MATIKIYDEQNSQRTLEFMNEGDTETEQMEIIIDDPDSKDFVSFYLSKSDAKELILYLKKQFAINP